MRTGTLCGMETAICRERWCYIDCRRWARNERATYDALAREWVPCDERVRFENTCMLFTTVGAITSRAFDVLARVREAKGDNQQVR